MGGGGGGGAAGGGGRGGGRGRGGGGGGGMPGGMMGARLFRGSKEWTRARNPVRTQDTHEARKAQLVYTKLLHPRNGQRRNGRTKLDQAMSVRTPQRSP
eukprot:scaffold103110_cov57-Phaeocystis_antarctica.AAC.1